MRPVCPSRSNCVRLSRIGPPSAGILRPVTTTKRAPRPKAPARKPASQGPSIDADALDAAILRFMRPFPNRTVDLGPLAVELDIDPMQIQLAVERLGRQRKVVVPFVEPGTAGGAELTAVGLRWLIEREGGTPVDVPAAFQPARHQTRTAEDAPRLPRSVVFGPDRRS